MKGAILLAIILLIIFIAALNVHIIRTEEGFNVTTKDAMILRDTYVDVRNWTLEDYMTHSPRIRNYLFLEKNYKKLKDMSKEDNVDRLIDSTKESLKPLERAIREWSRETSK